MTSNDGGQSWLAPAVLPTDGGHHSMNAPFDITVDTTGRAAVFVSSNGGQGDDVCATPKLSRSDSLTNWSTCTVADPDRANIGDGAGSSFFGLRFNPNNKLYAVFQQNAVTPMGEGIMFWRER